MIPRATYRLQFHKGFTFADAVAQVGYFDALGVSHLYASPILTARAGSLHGYDVIDHSRVNPELGGEDGLRDLVAALKMRGMGLIADIVPNHVAVGGADNEWWQDLLAKGPASDYAEYFDIDWDAPGLEGKVFAPFLGEEPEEALQSGTLKLVQERGGLAFAYYDHRFPLRPQDQGVDASEPRALLARQNYVLAHWREADERINWRRFFDITQLAAIRPNLQHVFEATHKKIFSLYAEGLLDGVRVDHVDGIADPAAYCLALRARLEAIRPGAYIVVEKILGEREILPVDWEMDGTTGYDFMNDVSALLHADDGGTLEASWRKWSAQDRNFEQEEIAARREVLSTKFAAQLEATTRAFAKTIRNVKVSQLRNAIAETIVYLRCYRSYANGFPDSPGAGPFLEEALARTVKMHPEQRAIAVRLKHLFEHRGGDPLVVDAVRRFSQLSAPVAAKAVEDTAFYRYGRLLSRNDVGFDPRCHRLTPAQFHERVRARGPLAMLATATHDHKRGEDSRMRLAVLSAMPEAWSAFLESAEWPHEIAPADVYQLYQSLLGAWPDQPDGDFADRMGGWCDKFLREGKLRSSWLAPDLAYEERFREFANALILARSFAETRHAIQGLLERIHELANDLSLAQVALRCLLPGMPDLYQGCEWKDLSLVDPDNRRPVDYNARRRTLNAGTNTKQTLLARLLELRRTRAPLFQRGTYEPVYIPGRSALGFVRRLDADALTVVVRLSNLHDGAAMHLDRSVRDLISCSFFEVGTHKLSDLLPLPVAVFEPAKSVSAKPTC